jgi:hypothetical protein
MADDGYASWYARKLWARLPAIYRTMDSADGSPGPLQEITARIGAQIATVRRGVDRMWENQSIETCDDWAIPYIGDLLATRMVACLDARAQRLDVAKTIYYRRRSGTVGLLEELAADIAGHDARVVEFFRRMGRTRHNFDPPLGIPPGRYDEALPTPPAVTEGLLGGYSRTPAGGFADLRNAYAAGNSQTAFDEFAHVADLRRGTQSAGWQNIPHLGVFIWWLRGYPITAATPVSNGAASPCFTFDPTGRMAPLFCPSSRSAESWGEHWASPAPWRLPTPIGERFWAMTPDALYPFAFWVGLGGGGAPAPEPRADLRIHPQTGVFSFLGAPPKGTLVSAYHFGFSSAVGAGGFDPRILPNLDEPAAVTTVAGATGLDTALGALAGDALVVIGDSATYPGLTAGVTLASGKLLVLRAADGERPLVRWTGGGAWTIQGADSSLTIQGVMLQGADIVLTGTFDTVRLRLATIDPGTSAAPSALFADAIDGVPLKPGALWIEGSVRKLILERSITGPIRTRNGGTVETLTASDSIIQSIPTHDIDANAPVLDPAELAAEVKAGADTLSVQLRAALPAADLTDLEAYVPGAAPSAGLLAALTAALQGVDRGVAETVYPLALADLALGFADGQVSLSRCTVLGPLAVHRLSASECILHGVARVEDAQHGCVRFSAYARGSQLHQPYRSVAIAPQGPVFESRLFGRPDYAKLRRDADRAILSPEPEDTILGGAQDGSEMGAFCLERNTLRRRGLAQKYEEFTPISMTPVWIDAD